MPMTERIPQKKEDLGRCFQLAAQYMLRHRSENLRLVHGTPYSVRFQARIGHAWIEVHEETRLPNGTILTTPVIVDPTQPECNGWPASVYYHHGEMTEEHVTRFTFDDMCRHLFAARHYGPWIGPALTAI